jgi:hypothetical protein
VPIGAAAVRLVRTVVFLPVAASARPPGRWHVVSLRGVGYLRDTGVVRRLVLVMDRLTMLAACGAHDHHSEL